MRDFKKIKAWQLADDFAVSIYGTTRDRFPNDERYGLTSQIRRAAVSVPSNIAEGAKRRHPKDYLRFLDMAYGSLAEVEYQLHLAHRLGYLRDDEYELLSAQRFAVGRTLYGLIATVREQIGRQHAPETSET
jgi:four helix bundle protein